MAEILPNR